MPRPVRNEAPPVPVVDTQTVQVGDVVTVGMKLMAVQVGDKFTRLGTTASIQRRCDTTDDVNKLTKDTLQVLLRAAYEEVRNHEELSEALAGTDCPADVADAILQFIKKKGNL